MKYRIKLLLFFVLILPFLQCGIDCDCNPVEKPFFDIKGVNLAHYTDQYTPLVSDTITFKDYYSLKVKYDVDFIAEACNHRNLNPFGSTLLACDCDIDGGLGSKEESYKSLTIITLNDFDSTHLANDTINDLFVLKEAYWGKDFSLDSLVAKYSAIPIILEEFNLSLQKAPELNKEFRVKCVVELTTGEVYEAVTEGVVILD